MRMITKKVYSKYTGREEWLSIPWDWLSDKAKAEVEAQELSDYDERMTQEAQDAEQDAKSK